MVLVERIQEQKERVERTREKEKAAMDKLKAQVLIEESKRSGGKQKRRKVLEELEDLERSLGMHGLVRPSPARRASSATRPLG